MEVSTLGIVVVLLNIGLVICLYFYVKSTSKLEKKVIITEQVNTSLAKDNIVLVKEKDKLISRQKECVEVIDKQLLIYLIVLHIITKINCNIAKYIYSPICTNIDKVKYYNLLISPDTIGVEIKALNIVKDKSVPVFYINISSLLKTEGFDTKVVNLQLFIEELSNKSYPELNNIYNTLIKNK